jgi:exonuclease SbcC
MIPLRVYLKNFLCHREQEFLFDEHPVWLLHGPNGVGKSAVFDAMVYALFGEHSRREGVHNAVGDLIRYGESSMRVEFDFEYRGKRYRVWRTRSRTGQPKQGVGEFLNGQPGPKPLRDVNSVRDFEQWVVQTLGLNYAEFVSAVLLRQGAAERLIDAKRDSRRDLFRGIIDLEPYINLHAVITTSRTEVNGTVRLLRARIEGMPEVTEEQITDATVIRDSSLAAWESSRAEDTETRQRLEQSRNWERLNQASLGLQKQLNAARDRANRAEELERSVTRFRLLRIVVPAITRITALLDEANSAQANFHAITVQHQNAISRNEELHSAAEQERQKVVLHRNLMRELDGLISTTSAECQRLRTELDRAKQAVDLHRQVHEARAKQFDSDLDSQLANAEEAVSQAQEARDSYPHLEAIFQNRGVYLQAASGARSAETLETTKQSELARLDNAVAEATQGVELARERAQTASHADAVANSQLKEAQQRLSRFSSVAGATVCSVCGQPIDAIHAERERLRLEQAVSDLQQEMQRCRAGLKTATIASEAAQQLLLQRESERRIAENCRNEATRNRREAESRATAARRAFANARTELSPGLANRIGEIESSVFPSQEEVNDARNHGRQLPGRIQFRNVLSALCRDRKINDEQIRTLTQAVQAIGAPVDMATVQVELTEHEQRLGDLNRDRATEDKNCRKAELAEQRLSGQIRHAADQLNQLASSLGSAETKLDNARKAHEEAVANLPNGATSLDPVTIANELQRLEAAHVEREFEALASDRALRTEWERNLVDIQRQIEEQIPLNARRPPADVQSQVPEAERRVFDADRERQLAQQRLATLTDQRVERISAQQELIDVERNHALHNRLAELLGAEGIQLFLLRNAERRITDLANEVLNRVSRGELRFEPPDPMGIQAFDLNVRRLGCPEPIPVGNLSGGQRCRVAISLALAVCRFACREAHPLQSVIIDEAFANLDREGRMAMIEILRDMGNAGEILRRIIVVSHHEDVASAFPVFYRLENSNGTTTVTRFGQQMDRDVVTTTR